MESEGLKFIAAGMTRRAFERSGRCVKVPVSGREDAGIGQNRAEYNNFVLADSLGLRCFPKAYSVSEDGSELEVELVERAETGGGIETMAAVVMKSARLVPGRYGGKSAVSVLAFGLGCALADAKKDGLDSYEKFARHYTGRLAFAKPGDYDNVEFYLDFCRRDIVRIAAYVVDERHSEPLAVAFRDLVRFAFASGLNFAIEDLWNARQWGFVAGGRPVALDGGFSRDVQGSGHYRRAGITPLSDGVKTTMPEDGSMTFNGEALECITDPNGGRVRCKFFTSKNTEYILSDGNMARRIKKAGLSDDGLYTWTDRMSFVGRDTLFDVMKRIKENNDRQLPTKVDSDWKSRLTLSSIGDSGDWEVSYSTNDISSEPSVGKHVLEFNFDGDGIVKGYHPGHDVSYIQWRRQW